jgi:monoamine oxidase
VVRISFACKEAFWENRLPAAGGEDLAKLSFLHGRAERVPTWWTSYPLQTRILTGWAGGPKAASLMALDAGERIGIAIDSLASITGLPRSDVDALIEDVYHHDWNNDPFARGAYSYVPAGAMDAVHRLAAPCEGTLFFAGEATDTTGNTGTVHGAIESGLRAANQVLTMG